MDTLAKDKARKLADEALAKLASELEAGKSETLRNYLASMGRFRKYSWNNVLLISSQRPAATRVAGIHAWNDLGRTVKKGEKGIMIFAPVVIKQEKTNPEQEPTASRLTGFRTAYVFDVAQTEGKALPAFGQTTGDPKEFAEKLKAIAVARGITVEYDPSIAPAMGVSSGGRIRLMPDLPKAEEFAVLAHELAHEMLHHAKDEERLPKTVRETQAEAVAYAVCQAAGLEGNNAAADYISLYNGEKKTLSESLAKIQETAARIIDGLLPSNEWTSTQEVAPTEHHGPVDNISSRSKLRGDIAENFTNESQTDRSPSHSR